MILENYFPTGIVTGAPFCNREEERSLLTKRLHQNAHVVLISPRRYGKSSLIAQFTQDQQAPFASVDLLPATSGKYVRNAIMDGVSSLISEIMSPVKKVKEKMLSYFSSMNPMIELSAFGQRVKLTPHEKTPEETIMKLLLNLDKAAGEMKKKLIFVMDEVQQIAMLENAHSLEASIRHAVERSKNVFYIFSGSNRTLLEEMFKNKDRPFYYLCDDIRVGRIDSASYHTFIAKAAKANWKTTMPLESIEAILSHTECHPYYVNRLCRILWDFNKMPKEVDIDKAWSDYVSIQKSDWVSEMVGALSVNQRAMLIALAKEPVKELNSQQFSTQLEKTASSIQRTISTLLKKDLVFKDDRGYYRVLNPVVRTYLAADPYSD